MLIAIILSNNVHLQLLESTFNKVYKEIFLRNKDNQVWDSLLNTHKKQLQQK